MSVNLWCVDLCTELQLQPDRMWFSLNTATLSAALQQKPETAIRRSILWDRIITIIGQCRPASHSQPMKRARQK